LTLVFNVNIDFLKLPSDLNPLNRPVHPAKFRCNWNHNHSKFPILAGTKCILSRSEKVTL